jgi:hypothetical protein
LGVALVLRLGRVAERDEDLGRPGAPNAEAVACCRAELEMPYDAEVAEGLSNEQIALRLGAGLRRMENHRAWVMERLGPRQHRQVGTLGVRP